MIKCYGIINFEDNHSQVAGLSKYRSIAAMNFLGRYRMVDIALSNMVNSGFDHIDVLCREKPRALMEHIANAEQYNINPKSGSLKIIYSDNEHKAKNLVSDTGLIYEVLDDIEDSPFDYVLVAPCNQVARINYQDVLAAHVASGADVTVVYKNVPEGADEFFNCRTLIMDEDGKITGGKWNLESKTDKPISMETYVMSKEMFVAMIQGADRESKLYDIKNYLDDNASEIRIQGYEYTGYLKMVTSLPTYYSAQMDLLDPENSKEFFDADWTLYTKTNDSAPTFYGHHSVVKNSIVSNGSHIDGEVENCIIGRGVYIGSGAKVKNSIILPGVTISADASIDYAVIDRDAQVIIAKEVIGEKDDLAYLDRKERV